MRLSARNILKGKVVALTRGATTTHVKVEIVEGMVVTASITNEAADDLGLMVGLEAAAIIKASDVMIGIEL
ncbi:MULTISPECIES: TOBE domain-containing protein [Pleomorphomonas]|uniref:TOBE domain-containing protein n=1 Tax=Pleomorphomonas TaxID=261933 RepID=UPI00047A4998|nr:TOBE domain-containing protein [Pleomorphomonas oryzae]